MATSLYYRADVTPHRPRHLESITMKPLSSLFLLALLGLLTLAAAPPSRPVTIEWAWEGTGGDAFVVDRCTVRGAECPMEPVITVPLSARSWTDNAVLRQRTYCYRLAAVTGGVRGPNSNTLCSP